MRSRALPVLALALTSCHQAAPESSEAMPTIAEHAWLTQALWDDGKAEIAFYEGWTEGNAGRRTFELATQLTKHAFDRAKQTKSDAGEPSFKWTLFYEVESGSEQLKHSYVANFARADLSPMKISANRFDWCSNQYRELAFLPDRSVHVLARSDDYGNSEETVELHKLTYPAAGVPMLVRALDFTKLKQVDFSLILLDGTYVDGMAELVGTEKVTTPSGETEAEKIIVHYAHAIDSTFGPRATKELYWRSADPARTLLKLESESGSYGLSLIEVTRAAYWQENIFERLVRVKAHP